MPNISDQLADLSPTKRALFETILRESRGAPERSEPAPIATLMPDAEHRYDPFPLTDMQQAYWVGRSGAISLGMATHMYEEIESDDLDIERLGRAWRQLVERHDALRAIVLPSGMQQVLKDVPEYTIAVTDMRGRSQEEVAAHLASTRERMSHQALASDIWPLFEIHATRLGERRYRIHVSMDGLLLDGWSYQILFREWIDRYEHPDTPVAPFEVSFRDYVLAELAGRESEAFQRARAYWDRRLPDLPPHPELPAVRSSDSVRTSQFVRRKARLSQPMFDKLKAQAVRYGLSAPAVLIAAYAEVLTTWSRHPHFTMSVGRFNRVPMHPDVNHLLGEFASFSLLEVDNAQGGGFGIRARRLQEQLWRDLDHSQVSGVELLRDLNRMRGGNTEVLMPIVFTLMPHEVMAGSAVSLGLADRSVFGLTQTSQLWLDCQAEEDGGALALNWDSVDEMFPKGLLDDMFAAYESFLRRLAEDESAWREERPQLVPRAQLEQRALVNATDAPIPPALLQDLFAERARLQPSHTALIGGPVTLTYAQLARRVYRLAADLRRRGLKPNTLAAVVMEKGPEQVIAALATLCAGGAYLPVDPAVPRERLDYLLQHAQAVVILTQPLLEDTMLWPDGIDRVSVVIDDDEAEAEPLEPVNTPDDLAYVIYTSGSTGLPKGVMIAQRGVVNSVLATNARFQVDQSDRVLALTALHHDMSVYDIFGVLAAGGTIVMPEARSTRDPAAWIELIARAGVTIWNSVPALMEMMVEYASAQQLTISPSLRLAFLGGDWISVTLPERLAALSSRAQVVSVGGPTETTLWNIWYPIEQVDPAWRSIPYGRPIANTKYHVLSELDEECPVWVPGMLHCSGVGVARGYWRDEEMTRSKFWIQPHSNLRLYRTGDVGRYLPDGTIEFLGRADFQVKIQGMRIELGEIEAALLEHPLIRSAVVTLAEDERTKGQLTAHVVLDSAAATSGAASLGDFVDAGSGQLEGLMLDPRERLAFKLQQHGVRRFDAGANGIALAAPSLDKTREAAYAARRSYRQFQSAPIPFAAFSEFLGSLAQMHFEGMPVPKYRYPSGGGLYPVQTYLHVKPDRVEGVAAGTYYYAPKEHRLVLLRADAALERALHISTNQAAFDMAAFSVFLVADMDAIQPMYGILARDTCLLEAGYIGQLLMQEGVARGIGLCPIGALRFGEIRPALDLKDSHVLLHSLVGGAIDVAQTLPSALVAERSAFAASEAGASTPDRQPVIAGLPEFLKRKLPSHMVPVSFIDWDAFPLTPNGKIDRKALIARGKGVMPVAASYTAPRNDIEAQIADAWRTVLGIDQVGVHDNFFDLGGNSLKLVLIHSVLQDTLKREINIVTLFQFPTISALAESLSGGEAEETASLDESASRAELRAQSRRERVVSGV